VYDFADDVTHTTTTQQPTTHPIVYRPALSNNYATLREIEGRLKSIKNIEKITKTMKIVASTRMNQAQRSMQSSRVYGQSSNKVFEEAEAKPVEGGKTLFIVSSSDKGLCGGVHSSLSKAVRVKLEANPNADVVVLGEKCKGQLGRSHPQNMVLSFAGIGKDVPTFATAQAIADQIAQLPTQYENIQIVYNSFLTPVSYEATTIDAFSEDAVKAAGTFRTPLYHITPIPPRISMMKRFRM
jgi:F-type H+-transporting ATPase subunit gamma